MHRPCTFQPPPPKTGQPRTSPLNDIPSPPPDYPSSNVALCIQYRTILPLTTAPSPPIHRRSWALVQALPSQTSQQASIAHLGYAPIFMLSDGRIIATSHTQPTTAVSSLQSSRGFIFVAELLVSTTTTHYHTLPRTITTHYGDTYIQSSPSSPPPPPSTTRPKQKAPPDLAAYPAAMFDQVFCPLFGCIMPSRLRPMSTRG